MVSNGVAVGGNDLVLNIFCVWMHVFVFKLKLMRFFFLYFTKKKNASLCK